MDRNDWYSTQHSAYSQAYSSPQVPVDSRVAADSVQDAHGLLAVYPFASATPSTQITRHLSSLSITSAPPSYTRALAYHAPVYSYPQHHFPSSSEYANELNHIASHSVPTNDGGYWENTRNDAVRYLGEQGYSYSFYQSANPWSQSYSYPSSYQTTPFAQSIFQHSSPSASYPTPPPPGINSSSSSLAYALGAPPPKPARTVYKPEESNQFFNNYVAQTNAQINAHTQQAAAPNNVKTTPRRPKVPPKSEDSSPDPLALTSSSGAFTPRKRKTATYLDSPTAKRQHISTSAPGSHPHPPARSSGSSSDTHSSGLRGSPIPKRKVQPFIDVPPLPHNYRTPTSRRRDVNKAHTPHTNGKGKQRAYEADDDLGGYGSDDRGQSPLAQRSLLSSGIKSSGKRATGERNDRTPVEKLATLLEDIFEAEDSLSPDLDPQNLPAEFFSPHSTDSSRPLLHPSIIRKLLNYTAKVSRPTKRLRLSARDGKVNGTPHSKGRMTELDTASLARILKILERSVKTGEDLEPFMSTSMAENWNTMNDKLASPRKASKASKKNSQNRRSQSRTPGIAEELATEDNAEIDGQGTTQEPAATDFEQLTRTLEIARDSVLAADCCIALLSSDRLTKQLYSEELIMMCLVTVKNQLSQIVYPFVDASADTHGHSPLLRNIVHPSARDSSYRRQLAEIFQALSSAIPCINNLICADAMVMSESIIIQAVYIAIGPFFVADNGGDGEGKGKKDSAVLNTLGSSAMRGLRLDALSLVRSIYANHEDQRAWIIEEILSSLIKLSDSKQKAGQFRLRDGRSIRTVSALLLQLVQTSAHDVRIQARALKKARQQASTMHRPPDSMNGSRKGLLLDEKDLEEIRLYTSGLDSATKAAKTIILFLTQRSGKSKVTKNSNEAEYRVIFDNLISDLLIVLFWPEWPAAGLLLSIICKFLVTSLDDIKSTNQNDNNAIRTLALDHLGVIAARLRSTTLKYQDSGSVTSHKLKSLDEVLSSTDPTQLQKLTAAHREIASFLSKRSSDDQAYDSARELTAIIWGQELAHALHYCGNAITDGDNDEFDPKVDRSKVMPFGFKLKDALQDMWEEANTDVFDASSQDELVRIDRLSEEIGTIQSFKNSFSPILNVVLQALDAPPVFMRTKALKALGQIITSDPSILSTSTVRHAIESHLLDSSSAVRDAAVELIGKYMIDSPEFAADYFPKIAERIADTGLGVRKRVIKLLKTFYAVTEDRLRRIETCIRIVLRMLDEDDTVKDLAVKTMEELWFQGPVSVTVKGRASSGSHDKIELLSRVSIIMGVSGHFKDRQSPLEDLLHQIMAGKEGSEAASLHTQYAEICETLIDGLVDASELPGFTIVNCVRTIHLFTCAYPAVLSGSNASTLLPYLKNASTHEEQVTSDYLLRIFRASIPHMPKTAAKFGQELQLALQPMIIKPTPAAGLTGLQETVACMCAIVEHITHDFGRLVALLRSCNARLQQVMSKPASQTLPSSEQRSLAILLYIVSLLCEHCAFDRVRVDREELRPEINAITKGPIIDHFYHTLLTLYDKYHDGLLRSRILQCLGFLFRAQPALMTAESSASIMDAIFNSPEEEARGRLLKIIQDFLMSEAAKHAAQEKEKASSKSKVTTGQVNMEELVGNTDGFADSGVSSAVVQRYLDPILQAALSQNAQIQAAAVDILSFTIKQGLAHPLQSFPIIVALETSPNSSISNRASALHSVLHSKHTSLLNARYVVSARASFDYQKKLHPGQVQGYRMSPVPTALLQRWYGLVREKRATRQDFLKAVVKVFDVELNAKTSQDDVDFVRYMAENFAAFEFKTQEEVLTVLKYLTAVLSTTGMQLVETLSPSQLLTQLHGPPQGQMQMQVEEQNGFAAPAPIPTPESNGTGPVEEKLPLMRTSVIVAMIMLLKAYLKALYSISEDKCTKYVVGKKSAVGDKPAMRRNERPMVWVRLPFATAPILTSADVDGQRARFLEIWSEDGLTAEPEDDMS